MPTIGWNESNPPDTESAGLGDDRIRSLTTSIRVGLDGEHVWPSGGGDAGVHRMGSARVFYGPQSTVSSAGTDGKMQFTSDTSRLFHVGSGGTSLIGGSRSLSVGTDAGFTYPQRHHWVEEIGVSTTGSARTITVTIPNSGFSGVPYTFIQATSPVFSGIGFGVPVVMAGNATSFVAGFFIYSNASWVDNQAFTWRSIGTRAL